MDKLKIIIHIEANPDAEIIGIKEDFANYCEKFGDVRMVEVEEDKISTNYDRAKAMSIEEMAESLMNGKAYCPYYHFFKMAQCNARKSCTDCIKEYLESEEAE